MYCYFTHNFIVIKLTERRICLINELRKYALQRKKITIQISQMLKTS